MATLNNSLCAALCAVLLMLAVAAPVAAQQQQGPVKPPPKAPDVRRLERDAPPEAPPIPVADIIQRFTKNESELKRAHDQFAFQLSVRLQEYPSGGGETGELQMLSETYIKADGKRYGRVLEEKPGNLVTFDFFREDLQDFAALPLFVLTAEDAQRYDIEYQGRQPLDELSTFIFRVRPKVLERRTLQFDGVVWVDEEDFVIVKTYGKWVAEVPPEANKMPFTMFETYRENVADKYWFPTFIRAEETVKNDRGEARLRLTVRYSEFAITPPRP